MNLCINCKFHRTAQFNQAGVYYRDDACGRTGFTDPVDGSHRGLDKCAYQRQDFIFGTTCGKKGKHFEAKS